MATQKYYVTVGGEGTIRWHKDAKCIVLHRDGDPAVEYANGRKEWWQNGQRHRTDGPAVEYADGSKLWWQNGQRHSTDGPAVEWADGTRYWYQNNQLHRTDGPAVEYANGRKEWCVNGKRLTEAEFLAATQPAVELTVADIEKLVGKRVKIVK